MGCGNIPATEAAQVAIPQVINEKDDNIGSATTGKAHGRCGPQTDSGNASRDDLQEIASFHKVPRFSFLQIAVQGE
jgi:hypothetical protein